MDKIEYKVIKYVTEKIKGNDSKYETDLDEDDINNEIGYYIEKLIDKRYIESRCEHWVGRGGSRKGKYNNNVVYIIYENLKILPKGEKAIEEYEMSKKEKIIKAIKDESKDFGKEVYKEGKKQLAKWIILVIGFILGLLVGIPVLHCIEKVFQ